RAGQGPRVDGADGHAAVHRPHTDRRRRRPYRRTRIRRRRHVRWPWRHRRPATPHPRVARPRRPVCGTRLVAGIPGTRRRGTRFVTSLELGLIGNGTLAALVDTRGDIVWACMPRLDGDPTFCALLQPEHQGHGRFAIKLENIATSSQHYL